MIDPLQGEYYFFFVRLLDDFVPGIFQFRLDLTAAGEVYIKEKVDRLLFG